MARVTEIIRARVILLLCVILFFYQPKCRCFEDNRSFECARRQISARTMTSSTAKFLAKFLPTTSKSVLQLALVLNYGTFVPRNFRSRERKFHRWNFCSRELSFPGTFVPRNLRSLELSSSRVKFTWNFRSRTLRLLFSTS